MHNCECIRYWQPADIGLFGFLNNLLLQQCDFSSLQNYEKICNYNNNTLVNFGDYEFYANNGDYIEYYTNNKDSSF